MARSRVATKRVAAGFENDIAFELGQAMASGLGVVDSVKSVLFDAGMRRYSDKVTAMLRRGGLEIEDGEKLDADMLAKLLSRGFDFDFSELSEDGIVGAVDAEVSRRVSEVIGFEVSSVLSADALASSIEAALVERVGNSGAGGLVSYKLLLRLKDAATWARAGYGQAEKRLVLMAAAQNRYRQNNRMVWD